VGRNRAGLPRRAVSCRTARIATATGLTSAKPVIAATPSMLNTIGNPVTTARKWLPSNCAYSPQIAPMKLPASSRSALSKTRVRHSTRRDQREDRRDDDEVPAFESRFSAEASSPRWRLGDSLELHDAEDRDAGERRDRERADLGLRHVQRVDCAFRADDAVQAAHYTREAVQHPLEQQRQPSDECQDQRCVAEHGSAGVGEEDDGRDRETHRADGEQAGAYSAGEVPRCGARLGGPTGIRGG
jgi:hypothetical protein